MHLKHRSRNIVLIAIAVLSRAACYVNAQAEPDPSGIDPNVKALEVKSITARLDNSDPFATASALDAATKLGDEIKVIIDRIDASRQKSLDLKKDFSAKATAQASNRTAGAFYEREIAKLDDGIRKLNGAKDSLAKMAAELSAKAEKARANPDVKAILDAEAAKARANKATEDLRKLTPQVLKP